MFIITTKSSPPVQNHFTLALTLPTEAPLVYLTEIVIRFTVPPSGIPIPTYPCYYEYYYDEPWDFLLDRSRVPDINYACLRAQLPATRDRFICPRVPSETSKELLKN